MPKTLNWNIIGPNIEDAREQLEEIEARIKAGKPPDPVEFQRMMQHAYHHLNFAWNARLWPQRRYAQLTEQDFHYDTWLYSTLARALSHARRAPTMTSARRSIHRDWR